ncbi:MAG: hypothetical protein MZV65_18530, partial [Chromatiales bacterium]|nr:hypothetical protein [Chromatiales bacterium]
YFVQLRIAKVNTKDTDNFLQHLIGGPRVHARGRSRTGCKPFSTRGSTLPSYPACQRAKLVSSRSGAPAALPGAA